MVYRLKVNEPIARCASRVGLEQIEIAQERLARGHNLADAIHDTRRCLKRLRALLRLIRPALPDSTYTREANRLAGIGRLLADARDQHVMQQTLRKLGDRFEAPPKRIGRQLNKLMANGAGPNKARASSAGRRQALQALEHARTFFARVEHRDVTIACLTAGLKRSYRRARRAFRDAYERPSDEAFHELRKTVQQHWRHMQLMSRCWPDVMSARASEAKEVSRLLGEDHDLHVLLAFATERGKAVLSAEELATLETMCRSLQAELRALARPRATRLFVEPASDLTGRIALYWQAARDLSIVEKSHDDAGQTQPKPTARRGRRRSVRQPRAVHAGPSPPTGGGSSPPRALR
jgi:CHAD domain-containing protein